MPVVDPAAAGGDAAAADAGVYLPTDRALSRAMSRVEQRLAAGEYHQALTFLQEVLSRGEDAFLDDPASSRKPTGLKATARRWIGELPAAGRKAYELLYGATARRRLEEALSSGSFHALAQVVREYYHTSAGYEAALVLAQIEADHGHQLAAAQLYHELIESPQAASQFEPQLSVLAALNHLAAGQNALASETLRQLFERHPTATLQLAGHETPIPNAEREPLAWLSQLTGQPVQTAANDPNWLTLHGDATRHTHRPGGAPHLRARWEARVINDPNVESFLSTRSEQFEQRGVAAIPAARPIAVGDVVLMRTPYNLVAVDWRTGKRVWETREEAGLGSDDLTADRVPGMDADEWTAGNSPLERRIWDDMLAMSLASDGERVFVVRGLAVESDDEAAAWQMAPFGGGMAMATSATNRLAAYDLATEGKLVWEIDGQRTGGTLTDAFFLGAPLAIDNSLFVLVEIRSAVYLFALDPVTGEVRWQQQLVGLETGIGLDPQRRLAGATPSYAGGILVCPTAAGAVIAIDIVKREFAWVYRYPRKVPTAADIRTMWQQQVQGQAARLNDRWLDNSARIVDGRVLVTPPESGELYCLDLRTGELHWKHPQSGALYVGCADQGHVLLVGNDSVSAVRLSDGSSAWNDKPLALPAGALPSGQGYLSDGKYYLPLTSGQIVAIDVGAGTITSASETKHDSPLGNLICFRGSVVSQSALVLDKFEQLDVLGRRAEAALAANPNDATAVRELAEMKRVEGNLPEAITLLKRAYELEPTDVLTQEMLAEALLESLASDFTTFRDDLPLVRRLIHGQGQEIKLLRIEALGLEKRGEWRDALAAYLRLVDLTSAQPLEITIEPGYTVRSDRWTNGSLGRLWSAADAAEREAIEESVGARRPAITGNVDADDLRRYLAHFDRLPGAEPLRLALATQLVERKVGLEAELALLALGPSASDESQAAASALMARLFANSGQQAKPRNAWHRGRIDVSLRTVSAPTRDRLNRVQAERQIGFRRLRLEQDFATIPDAIQWFVSTDSAQLIGRDPSGGDVFQLGIERSNMARQQRNGNRIQAARLGHLLFVSVGGRVIAIETRHGENASTAEVLWQAYPSGRFPASRMRRVSNRGVDVYHSWSDRERGSGTTGSVTGVIGPATPLGIVVQDQDELRCLDPLTGEAFWSRSGLPVGCELFGDEELVIAAVVDEREAWIFSAIDGHLLEKRNLPPFPWMLTAGRNVAHHTFDGSGSARRLVLKVTDVASGETLFESRFDPHTRLSVVEPGSLAVFEPSGKFQLIDVQSGKIVIDQELEEVSKPQNLETLAAGDTLFVAISQPVQQQRHRPISADMPLINGTVYAISLTSGEQLWPAPAVVRNRGIALGQPSAIPLLVFVDRKMKQDAGGGSAQLRLLCLDKATGQTVYRNDELPDTAGGRFSIRTSHDANSSMTIEMSAREAHLAISDQPRPPAPPANDDIETRRAQDDGGLWGVGRRIGEVLQEALQNPPATNRAPGTHQPPQNLQDFDDD